MAWECSIKTTLLSIVVIPSPFRVYIYKEHTYVNIFRPYIWQFLKTYIYINNTEKRSHRGTWFLFWIVNTKYNIAFINVNEHWRESLPVAMHRSSRCSPSEINKHCTSANYELLDLPSVPVSHRYEKVQARILHTKATINRVSS